MKTKSFVKIKWVWIGTYMTSILIGCIFVKDRVVQYFILFGCLLWRGGETCLILSSLWVTTDVPCVKIYRDTVLKKGSCTSYVPVLYFVSWACNRVTHFTNHHLSFLKRYYYFMFMLLYFYWYLSTLCMF